MMTNGGCDEVELRAMRDAWRALRDEWGLDPAEAFALLKGDDGGRTLGEAVETRMRILLVIGYRLDASMDPDGFRDRLRRPAAAFGWLSPLEAMSGTMAELRAVRSAVEGEAWS